MKVFHCDHCQQLVFFENVSCVKCGHILAYLPDADDIASLAAAEGDVWRSAPEKPIAYARIMVRKEICNWAIPAEAADTLCDSCRLTCVIPDLGVAGNRRKMVSVGSGEAAIDLQSPAIEFATREQQRAGNGTAIRVPGRLAGAGGREGAHRPQ